MKLSLVEKVFLAPLVVKGNPSNALASAKSKMPRLLRDLVLCHFDERLIINSRGYILKNLIISSLNMVIIYTG